MPLYKYIAINSHGENLEGTYNAGDRAQVLQMIREKQFIPVNIQEVVSSKEIDALGFLSRVTPKDIAIFCRQFYTMLNAGVTIIKALDILHQQTENKKLRTAIGEVYEDVQKGSSFSEALRKRIDIFPELLINMVEAGEVSGNLDAIMSRMAVNYEKDAKLRNKVKGAMVYPIVLSIVATLVVIFLLTFVMPTFFSMFQSSGVQLPLPTRILLGISGILKGYWYLLILGLILIVYAIRRWLSSDAGRLSWDRFKLRVPIVKATVKKIITSRFTRTMSTLLSSGIPLLQAMEITSKVVGNRVAADGLLNAREDIRKGMDLAGPIRRIGVFPPMVDSMIRIGEESGTLDEILGRAADFYDDEVETAMQRMVSLLDPVLILIMASIIGFIVISMALPMFDMMQTVK